MTESQLEYTLQHISENGIAHLTDNQGGTYKMPHSIFDYPLAEPGRTFHDLKEVTNYLGAIHLFDTMLQLITLASDHDITTTLRENTLATATLLQQRLKQYSLDTLKSIPQFAPLQKYLDTPPSALYLEYVAPDALTTL